MNWISASELEEFRRWCMHSTVQDCFFCTNSTMSSTTKQQLRKLLILFFYNVSLDYNFAAIYDRKLLRFRWVSDCHCKCRCSVFLCNSKNISCILLHHLVFQDIQHGNWQPLIWSWSIIIISSFLSHPNFRKRFFVYFHLKFTLRILFQLSTTCSQKWK